LPLGPYVYIPYIIEIKTFKKFSIFLIVDVIAIVIVLAMTKTFA